MSCGFLTRVYPEEHIYGFFVSQESDLVNLPKIGVNGKVSPLTTIFANAGSTALNIETGITYILDGDNEWKEKKDPVLSQYLTVQDVAINDNGHLIVTY